MVAVLNLVVLTVGLNRELPPNHPEGSHLLTLLEAVLVLFLDGSSKHRHRRRLLTRNHDLIDWQQMMTVSRLTGVLTDETKLPHKPLHRHLHLSQLSRNLICSLTLRRSDLLSLCLQDRPSLRQGQLHRPSDLRPLSRGPHHDQFGTFLRLVLLPCRPRHSTDFKAQLILREVTMPLLTLRTRPHYRPSHKRTLSPFSSFVTVP